MQTLGLDHPVPPPAALPARDDLLTQIEPLLAGLLADIVPANSCAGYLRYPFL